MNKKIIIELSSNLDYEEMVVYLSIENHELAIVNYERGIEHVEVELLPLPSGVDKLSVPFEVFMDSLRRAKEILIKCSEDDKTREKF